MAWFVSSGEPNRLPELPELPKLSSGTVCESGSSLRDERLPKGPRFASESLDADTGSGTVFQTDPLLKIAEIGRIQNPLACSGRTIAEENRVFGQLQTGL
jgi:hypothetical protein